MFTLLVQRVPLLRVHIKGSVGALVITHESLIDPSPVFTRLLLFRKILCGAGGGFTRRRPPPDPSPGVRTEDHENPPPMKQEEEGKTGD